MERNKFEESKLQVRLEVLELLKRLRLDLEQSYKSMPYLAAPGTVYAPDSAPSTGFCAITALVIYSLYGGYLVSTRQMGVSHWFNRIQIPNNREFVDVDLTGDQFGLSPVQMSSVDGLYKETIVRDYDKDVSRETLDRAATLAASLGLQTATLRLRAKRPHD